MTFCYRSPCVFSFTFPLNSSWTKTLYATCVIVRIILVGSFSSTLLPGWWLIDWMIDLKDREDMQLSGAKYRLPAQWEPDMGLDIRTREIVTHEITTWNKTKSPRLNQWSHPGCPKNKILKKEIEKQPSIPMNLFLTYLNFYTNNMIRKLENAGEQMKRKVEITCIFTIKYSFC